MSERANSVHQLHRRIEDSFDRSTPSEIPLLKEYRNALGRVNFLKLNSIFADLEKKLGLNFRDGKDLASIEFFNELDNPASGLYSPAGIIKLNMAYLESGLENARAKFPRYDMSVLREFAIVRNYIHELIHHYTNSLLKNKTSGFEFRLNDERYYLALNEAMTELLTQYIFYKYIGDRFPMKGKENNIAYFEFSIVLRELLYLSIEDQSSSLYKQPIESAWFIVVKDFFDPEKRVEDNFLYQTIKKLGPQFVLDFINLGSSDSDEYEQSLIVSGLMRSISNYRIDGGLEEFAFPMVA